MHMQTAFLYEKLLIKRVLGRIGQGLRLVVADLIYFNTEHFEYFE